MKSRGQAKRNRSHRKQGTRRQAAPVTAAVAPGTPPPPPVAPPSLPPVAGVSHRQVLDDIRKIGIIGGAALLLLLVLFLVWR